MLQSQKIIQKENLQEWNYVIQLFIGMKENVQWGLKIYLVC